MVRAREPRGAYSADKWIFQKGGMFGSLCSAGGWAVRILLNLDLLPRRQQTRRINRLWQRGGSGVGRGVLGGRGRLSGRRGNVGVTGWVRVSFKDRILALLVCFVSVKTCFPFLKSIKYPK